MNKRYTILIFVLILFSAGAFLSAQENRGIVRFGIVYDTPPVSFINEEGNPDGYIVDLFSRIFDEMGISYQFIPSDYTHILEKIQTGELDFFGTFIRSEEREKMFYFGSESIAGGWGQLFINKDSKYDSIQSLRDQKIGMVHGDEIGENFRVFMKELQIPFTAVEFVSFNQMVKSVRSGELYGGVIYNSYLLGIKNVLITPTVFSPQPAYPVTSTDGPYRDLMDRISLRLKELKADESSYYYVIQRKWTDQGENRYKTFFSALLAILLIMAAVTAFLVINGRILKKTIRRRTRELEQASTVLDHSLEGIMITDRDLNIIRVNKAFEEITGYKSREVLGKPLSVLKSPDRKGELTDEILSVIREKGKWAGETLDRRKNGEIYPQHKSIVLIRDGKGKPLNYSFVFHDLTQNRDLENRIHYISNYDGQTDLPNKSLFLDRLVMAGVNVEREKNILCVISLGIDNFKRINRTFGYEIGDELLREIGKRLKNLCRKSDTIARYSGDEFTILLTDFNSREDVIRIVEKIKEEMEKPFVIDNRKIFTSCSQGISMYPSDSSDINEIPGNANQALHTAKKRKKGSYFFYTEEDDRILKLRHNNEILLRSALDKGEILVYYQPKFNISRKKITGVEALVRWNRNGSEIIYPDEFISILEESGQIVKIGEYIMRTACRDISELNRSLDEPLKLAVNLSAVQFSEPSLVKIIREILNETGFPPELLEVEITETIAMNDIENTLLILHELTSMGVGIAVDDFGTGYSSFSYLQQFPLTTLKIDKSFIDKMELKEEHQGIVKTIISLAEIMNLNVIAEGVETLDQIEILQKNQCNEAQGYYISKPTDIKSLKLLINSKY